MEAKPKVHPRIQMTRNFFAVVELRRANALVQYPFLVYPHALFFEPFDDEEFEAHMEKLLLGKTLIRMPLDPVRRHHGTTARWSLRGRLPGGLLGDQWILHVGKDGDRFWEFDIDDGSPVDVVGIVAHAIQVREHQVLGTKTDPHEMAEVLRKGGMNV